MAAILLKNRYRVLRELADGRFGKTFLAEDTQTPSGKKCIIKQLKPINNHLQIYQLVKEKFQREAAILATLGDNNSQVPRLYAYFAEAEGFYLVQEWIQGQTLSDRIQQVGLCSEREAKEILLSILLVLQYIHSQGVTHRNINPNNIIWRSLDSKPVLIDFGMVKEIMGMTVTASGRAKSSIVVGTLGFVPSEQAEGKPLFASDLYALGLTAIYLLTGKMPPEFKTNPLTEEILWRQHAPNVSPSFAAILSKTIQPSARDRYMNAPAMLAALQQLDTHTVPVVPPQPQSPPVSAIPKPQSPPPSSTTPIPQSPPPVSATPISQIANPPQPQSPHVLATPTPTIVPEPSFPQPTMKSNLAGKVGMDDLNAAFPASISHEKFGTGEKFNTATPRGGLAWVKAGLFILGSLAAVAVLLFAISYMTTRPKSNSSSNNSPTATTEPNSELSTPTSPLTANNQPSAVSSESKITATETPTKNFSERIQIGQLKNYTYSTKLFSINVPQNWQRRDRSTTGEAIVSWYDPTNNAAIVVDVFSQEAFRQKGQISQERLSRFLAKAAQQQYSLNPNFQLASTEAVNSGWQQINWSYTVGDRQGEKGKMLGYGYVRQDSEKISYIHFILPEAQYPQLRSQLGKITTSYSINPTAPLP
jgi:serine/threonine protein kinase